MNYYFKQPGQSSGKLATFRNGGDYSPDCVLEYERLVSAGAFWQYAFELGNALECLCYDLTHDSRTFFDKFFISDHDNEPPDDIGRVIVNNPAEKHAELFEKLVVWNKPDKSGKVEKNKTYSKRHAYIEECLANPGRMPISQTDYKILKELADKMAALPLPDWYRFRNAKVGDVWGLCEWQYPVYWESGGIGKKALCDNLFFDESGYAILMDIKYSASLSNFLKMMRTKYWIQAEHYREGVSTIPDTNALPMLFVVGVGPEKGKPPMATIRQVDERDFEKCREEYHRVSLAYHAWEQSGRLPVGRLDAKQERVWL